MDKQLIISVGREYGSGGHMIAERLAKRFGLPLYDSNLLNEIAEVKDLDVEELKKFDEMPHNRFLSRNRVGFFGSPEDYIAHVQFEYLREKADKGESFVIVGRCAESVLRRYDALYSIFVVADRKTRIDRIVELENITPREADILITQMDKKRKTYHNFHCEDKWGDSRTYDICIDSSKLGIDGTTDVLEHDIRTWLAKR